MSGKKVAVVTGGANGIGKCIAEEFRKAGVLLKRGEEHAESDRVVCASPDGRPLSVTRSL